MVFIIFVLIFFTSTLSYEDFAAMVTFPRPLTLGSPSANWLSEKFHDFHTPSPIRLGLQSAVYDGGKWLGFGNGGVLDFHRGFWSSVNGSVWSPMNCTTYCQALGPIVSDLALDSSKENLYALSTNLIASFANESTPIISVSRDGGSTWSPLLLAGDSFGSRGGGYNLLVSSKAMVAVGFVKGNFSSSGGKPIYYSYDGGKTWNGVDAPLPPMCLAFSEEMEMFIAGAEGGFLIASSENLSIWKPLLTPSSLGFHPKFPFLQVAWSAKQRLFVAANARPLVFGGPGSGGLAYSADGFNWTVAPSSLATDEGFGAVQYSSVLDIWVAGSHGGFLQSSDGKNFGASVGGYTPNDVFPRLVTAG